MRKLMKGFLCAAIFGTAASFAEMWCNHVPDRPAGVVQLIENEAKRPGEPTSWRFGPVAFCFGTASICGLVIYAPECAELSRRCAHRLLRGRRRAHG